MQNLRSLLSIVILTFNRASELRTTMRQLLALPEVPDIVIVDNASTDDTVTIASKEFPQARLIRLRENIGAAARNIGVEAVRTPYVAFCDDDSWWAPGSLEKAAEVFEAYPRVAALCARILLGPQNREDPICRVLADSPLPSDGLPGRSLLGFIACATIVRRRPYLDAGGYEQKFFVGGEEELLSLDLVSNGWRVVYLPELTVHHHPSPQRDNPGRQVIVIRNSLWVSWLRLPLRSALRETLRTCHSAKNPRILLKAVGNAARELPWVWRKRKVLAPETLRLYHLLHQ